MHRSTPLWAPVVVKPQQQSYWLGCTLAPVCSNDIHPMQCSSAKSPVDDSSLSQAIVLGGAAASLRSFEIKAFDWQICPLRTGISVTTTSEVGVCKLDGVGVGVWGLSALSPPAPTLERSWGCSPGGELDSPLPSVLGS